MKGFIIRVCAYHGEPKLVGDVPTRSGASVDTPVPNPVKDLDEVNISDLMHVFERAHGCKVNFGETIDSLKEGTKVYEFDVFEPSWKDVKEARHRIDALTNVLVGWSDGMELL